MDPTTPTPSADEASPNASGKAAPSDESPAEPWQVGLKTDEELKQLARDIMAEKVFIDRLVFREFGDPQQGDMASALRQLELIFVPFGMAGSDVLDGLAAAGGMLYEYYDKATERSCNGWPMFWSFQVVHRQQLEPLQGYIQKILTALADL